MYISYFEFSHSSLCFLVILKPRTMERGNACLLRFLGVIEVGKWRWRSCLIWRKLQKHCGMLAVRNVHTCVFCFHHWKVVDLGIELHKSSKLWVVPPKKLSFEPSRWEKMEDFSWIDCRSCFPHTVPFAEMIETLKWNPNSPHIFARNGHISRFYFQSELWFPVWWFGTCLYFSIYWE